MQSYFSKCIFMLATCIVLIGLFSGCGKQQAADDGGMRTVTYENQSYTIPAHPQRIVALSNSVLQMLYAVDGTAVGRVETNDKLPEAMAKLPTVGHTATLNMEQLLGLKPDLVLGLKNQTEKYQDQLNSNKIPNILLTYDGINDNVPLLAFLGEITNNQAKAKEVIATYEKNMKTVKDVAKQQTPIHVAVLRATGKSVTAETDRAITASMVQDLGMINVATKNKAGAGSAKTVPYSLEQLAVDNPDVIFIVTMGKKDEIAKTMEKEMTSNPAWSHLKAVENHKVFYLPSQLFLLNPGLQAPQAMTILLKDAYGMDATF